MFRNLTKHREYQFNFLLIFNILYFYRFYVFQFVDIILNTVYKFGNNFKKS